MDQISIDLTALVLQAQQGDDQAFGEACRVVEARLLRQATLLCGEPSMAQDLAQDTLIEAWRCLGRYNGTCQFFTWLCAILHNRYRGVVRRRRLVSFLSLNFSHTSEPTALDVLPDLAATPDQAAHSKEQAALVRRCIHSLPRKQQQVIYLRFFVDDSLEGIALALGCSEGTVKSRLFHALEKLRRMPALHDSAGKSPWRSVL